MDEKQIEQLRDIQGWIEFCIASDKSQGWCLANIGHDVNLILADQQDGSLPRTDGYASYLPSRIVGGD